MFKIGLSSSSNEYTDDFFRYCANGGIEVMEITRCTAGYDGFDFDKVSEMAQHAGIKLWSVHLPFKPSDKFDISKKSVSEYAVEHHKRLIHDGANVGIRTYVVHPSSTGISANERESRIQCAKQSLSKLAEYADNLGVKIAVENMAHDCLGNNISEFLDLISTHPSLCACFDVNHLLNDDPVDLIRKIGTKLITMHVSDCDLINERHWFPGEGKIDFQRILGALAEVGYSGPWLYEVTFRYPRMEENDPCLSPSDFTLNAKELFAGKSPTLPRGKRD